MEIRTATYDDLKHVLDMRIAYLRDIHVKLEEKELDALLKHLPDYYRRHMGRDFFAYFALNDDKPVSTVYLLIIERPATPNFVTGKTAILMNVYTDPAYRKQGLASVLLNMAITDAKKADVSRIELQATDMGIPVYEKLGFKHKPSQYTYMEYRFDAPDDTSTAKA